MSKGFLLKPPFYHDNYIIIISLCVIVPNALYSCFVVYFLVSFPALASAMFLLSYGCLGFESISRGAMSWSVIVTLPGHTHLFYQVERELIFIYFMINAVGIKQPTEGVNRIRLFVHDFAVVCWLFHP